jgi:4,5-dihydroxyphthalate decarboxylase
METLAGFSHEQGLTPRRLSLDELFLPMFQGRKRGDEHRI